MQIDNWNLGVWDSHEIGLPFGEFAVLPDHGYFLRCTANSTSFHDATLGKG